MRNNRMSDLQIRRMIYAALYLAIAMILPFMTGQIPQIGAMLCPMHIPVLLSVQAQRAWLLSLLHMDCWQDFCTRSCRGKSGQFTQPCSFR